MEYERGLSQYKGAIRKTSAQASTSRRMTYLTNARFSLPRYILLNMSAVKIALRITIAARSR